MTPEQVTLVKESFAKVEPIAEDAAAMFYDILFQMDPDLKDLFKGDMKEQGRKLMASLKMVVASLDRLGEVKDAVEKLGVRHLDYGVEFKDYDTVGAALLVTLQQGLGDAFTEDVKDAWMEAYLTLSEVMMEAAQNAQKN